MTIHYAPAAAAPDRSRRWPGTEHLPDRHLASWADVACRDRLRDDPYAYRMATGHADGVTCSDGLAAMPCGPRPRIAGWSKT